MTLFVIKVNALMKKEDLRNYRQNIIEDMKEGVLIQTPEMEEIIVSNVVGEVGLEFLREENNNEESNVKKAKRNG